MKKFIKSVVKEALAVGVVLGVVLLTGESENMNTQIVWSLAWMAEAFVCGWLLVKLFHP